MATTTGDLMDRKKPSQRFADGSSIVRAESLPWTPWVLNGSSFKLLSINRATGVWSALIRVEHNTQTQLHHHFGNAHIFVIKGGYAYGDDPVKQGDFNLERGTIAHEPRMGPDGMISYVMFFGGISGVDENGHPTGEYIDAEWMYRAAKANNAADHLPPSLPVRTDFA